MKPTINNSDKSVIQEVKRYTGVTKAKVILINPTLSELNNIGINIKEEPKYRYEKKNEAGEVDVIGHRLDVWIETEVGVKTKFSCFIDNAKRTNKDGNKIQVVNSRGDFGWSESVEAISNDPQYHWFKNEKVRPAFSGEENLMEFIKAWFNVDTRDESLDIQLENIHNFAEKGDKSEFNKILSFKTSDGKALKDNEFKVLLKVRKSGDKVYQDVYTGAFGRASSNNKDFWIKAINDEYKGIKDFSEIQNSIDLKEYEESGNFISAPDVDDNPDTTTGNGAVASWM